MGLWAGASVGCSKPPVRHRASRSVARVGVDVSTLCPRVRARASDASFVAEVCLAGGAPLAAVMSWRRPIAIDYCSEAPLVPPLVDQSVVAVPAPCTPSP